MCTLSNDSTMSSRDISCTSKGDCMHAWICNHTCTCGGADKTYKMDSTTSSLSKTCEVQSSSFTKWNLRMGETQRWWLLVDSIHFSHLKWGWLCNFTHFFSSLRIFSQGIVMKSSVHITRADKLREPTISSHASPYISTVKLCFLSHGLPWLWF